MDRVLILDTETTGLDPEKDSVIEVGCVLYSVAHATALESFSTLVECRSNPAEPINRIPAAVLGAAPRPGQVWERVLRYAEASEAILAHRAEFDRSFSPAQVQGVRPWICTKFDVEWPRQTRPGSSLVPLALEHGLGVSHAHRAMADCDLISRLLTRSRELGADIEAMLVRGLRPKVRLIALVSYDDRQMAKDAGFQWDPESKRWLRVMAPEDAGALPFGTTAA